MLTINCLVVSFVVDSESKIFKVTLIVCSKDWLVTIVVCALSLSNPELIMGELKALYIVNPPVTFTSFENDPISSTVLF